MERSWEQRGLKRRRLRVVDVGEAQALGLGLHEPDTLRTARDHEEAVGASANALHLERMHEAAARDHLGDVERVAPAPLLVDPPSLREPRGVRDRASHVRLHTLDDATAVDPVVTLTRTDGDLSALEVLVLARELQQVFHDNLRPVAPM